MAEINNYPYLGVHYVEKNEEHLEQSVCYVVLFTEPDYGVCVMNNTNLANISFAKIGDYAEETFEMLPIGMPIRLTN